MVSSTGVNTGSSRVKSWSKLFTSLLVFCGKKVEDQGWKAGFLLTSIPCQQNTNVALFFLVVWSGFCFFVFWNKSRVFWNDTKRSYFIQGTTKSEVTEAKNGLGKLRESLWEREREVENNTMTQQLAGIMILYSRGSHCIVWGAVILARKAWGQMYLACKWCHRLARDVPWSEKTGGGGRGGT